MENKLTKINYNSKRVRQIALKEKIQQIDDELNNLGVLDIKYILNCTITNPETPQNTINISSITDLSFAIRLLAYFQNIKEIKNKIEKDHNLPKTFILKNQNGFNVCDIIHDLNLKINTLLYADKIKILTETKTKLLPFLDEESRFINTLREVEKLLKNE